MHLFRSALLSPRAAAILMGFASVVCVLAGCGDIGQNPAAKNNLDLMQTSRVQVDGHPFEVWLALTALEQEHGLMQVTEDALAAIPGSGSEPDVQRGMLFVFEREKSLSFWMFNTIIPLDIAYINSEGRIVMTYTMAPLETRGYPSIEPAQFALEMKAGLLAELGITVGDTVEIPDSVLKDRS